MPVLANARHERFAQELAKGKSQVAAYEAAEYKPNESHASRMVTNGKIADRVVELKTSAADKAELDIAYVLTTIHETIERCKQAKPVLDRKGVPVFTELPNGDVAPAYAFDSGAVLKGAELLGKHFKMFTDKHEHTGKDGASLIPDDTELARLIAFMLTKAAG